MGIVADPTEGQVEPCQSLDGERWYSMLVLSATQTGAWVEAVPLCKDTLWLPLPPFHSPSLVLSLACVRVVTTAGTQIWTAVIFPFDTWFIIELHPSSSALSIALRIMCCARHPDLLLSLLSHKTWSCWLPKKIFAVYYFFSCYYPLSIFIPF